MNEKRLLKSIVRLSPILVGVIALGCGTGAKPPNLTRLSKDLLQDAPRLDADLLRTRRVICLSRPGIEGVSYPSDTSFYGNDSVLIVDNPGGRIVKVDLADRAPTEPKTLYSNLEAPFSIALHGPRVAVTTNVGIVVFDGLDDKLGELTPNS